LTIAIKFAIEVEIEVEIEIEIAQSASRVSQSLQITQITQMSCKTNR